MKRNKLLTQKRKRPFFGLFKAIVKLFTKKPKLIVKGQPLDDGCLLLGNHANKNGPLMYDVYLPLYTCKWGAYQMLCGYKDRFLYLRNVLYIQKNGYGKFAATIKALFEACFSKFIYKGLNILPSYPDTRLLGTVKSSVEALKNDVSVMIYPEDSSKGYHDVITSFLAGFTLVMSQYKKETGKDVAVRPAYYHKKKSLIIVGEKYYYDELTKQGISKREFPEFFKNKVNKLYAYAEREITAKRNKKQNNRFAGDKVSTKV